MAEVFDFKKKFKHLYQPPATPGILQIPPMQYIMFEGKGDPNQSDGEYSKAVVILYGLSYSIKMSHKNGHAPQDYFEYSVPPLEGLWWMRDETMFDPTKKSELCFISMIRQPDFVTQAFFEWAVNEVKRKKKEVDPSSARLVKLDEGLCVQVMHHGPYATEPETVTRMSEYVRENGYLDAIGDVLPDGQIRRHHEIYLTDPRKCSPEKMRTVLRHPVKLAAKA